MTTAVIDTGFAPSTDWATDPSVDHPITLVYEFAVAGVERQALYSAFQEHKIHVLSIPGFQKLVLDKQPLPSLTTCFKRSLCRILPLPRLAQGTRTGSLLP